MFKKKKTLLKCVEHTGREKIYMTVFLNAEFPQIRNVSAYKTGYGVQNTSKASLKNDDSILSDKCTDGKDDGKIGFFNAVGHVVKGAGNTLVDTVKGCFTDEKGDFSIGKTLLTAGTAAACIAFPPLGLAACAAGATIGAIKVGHGVYNAATAKTDAEAKKAWQEVGGGALTAGASAVGAKSSLGAMKAASTAGKAGGSALGELEENASIAQKAVALGKDAVSSTKNNASSIKASALEAKDAVKTAKEAADYKIAKAKAEKVSKSGALTSDEAAIVREADAREAFLSDGAKAILNKADGAYNAVKAKIQGVKSDASSVKEAVDFKRAEAKAAKLKDVGALTDEEAAIIKEAEIREAFLSDAAKAKIAKAENLSSTLKEGVKHPVETAKSGIAKIKSLKLSDIKGNLSEKAKLAFNAIKEKGYSDAMQKYGYDAVYEALAAAAGATVANQQV